MTTSNEVCTVYFQYNGLLSVIVSSLKRSPKVAQRWTLFFNQGDLATLYHLKPGPWQFDSMGLGSFFIHVVYPSIVALRWQID